MPAFGNPLGMLLAQLMQPNQTDAEFDAVGRDGRPLGRYAQRPPMATEPPMSFGEPEAMMFAGNPQPVGGVNLPPIIEAMQRQQAPAMRPGSIQQTGNEAAILEEALVAALMGRNAAEAGVDPRASWRPMGNQTDRIPGGPRQMESPSDVSMNIAGMKRGPRFAAPTPEEAMTTIMRSRPMEGNADPAMYGKQQWWQARVPTRDADVIGRELTRRIKAGETNMPDGIGGAEISYELGKGKKNIDPNSDEAKQLASNKTAYDQRRKTDEDTRRGNVSRRAMDRQQAKDYQRNGIDVRTKMLLDAIGGQGGMDNEMVQALLEQTALGPEGAKQMNENRQIDKTLNAKKAIAGVGGATPADKPENADPRNNAADATTLAKGIYDKHLKSEKGHTARAMARAKKDLLDQGLSEQQANAALAATAGWKPEDVAGVSPRGPAKNAIGQAWGAALQDDNWQNWLNPMLW